MSVDVEGNHSLKKRFIVEKLGNVETSWIPFSDKHYLDLAVLETDKKRISRIYEDHGYYDAKLTDTEIVYVSPDRKKAKVRFRVEEGNPSLVNELSLTLASGQALATLPPEVVAALGRAVALKHGDPFTVEGFDRTQAELEKALREKGYALEKIERHAVVDAPRHQVTVTYRMDPGTRYHFGPVEVIGNRVVASHAISEKVASAASPGAFYSDSDVAEAQKRVYDMGVFSLARVSHATYPPDGGEVVVPVPPDAGDLALPSPPDGGNDPIAAGPDAGLLPLTVEVVEAPFHTIRAGGGFGVEPARQEVRAQAEWTDRNFLGGLRKLDFDNELAYVVTPSVVQLFSKNSGGNQGVDGHSTLTFSQPDVAFENLTFNATLGVSRDIEVGYTYNALTSSVGLSRNWGRKVELSGTYNYQLLQLQGQLNPAQLSQSTAPALGNNCPGQTCFLRLSYLEQRLTLDFRDNAIAPHQGFMLLADVQEGGGPGASFQYYRLAPEARVYIPLGDPVVLALRGAWGAIKEIGNSNQATPITQRFFGGGPLGARGYGSRLMSPVLVACVPVGASGVDCSQAQAVPVGGDGFFLASAELRLDLGHDVGVVGFVDMGEVSVDAYTYNPADLAINPGFGLRYKTLFGPLRLDVAWRVPNREPGGSRLRLAPSEQVLNYPPSPGAPYPEVEPNVNRWDFQFSIGEAF